VYRVTYSRQARAQAASLPPAGRRALAEAVEQLGSDPSLGQRAPGYLPEFHTLPFGEWGLVFYLVRERHGTVVLLDLVWAGP
jgi:mRNA-degrading endonuclease RelE of RelBE toxin-antitoxin system